MAHTHKSIIGIEARDKVIAGANYVADAVKSTLGPFGLNTLTEKRNTITNDGFTTSREICTTLPCEFERRGAILMHEAASKTNDQVGDATSTSMVLAQAILKEAVRYLPQVGSFGAKKTPAELVKTLKEEKAIVLEKLSDMVTPITSREELIRSALVSVEDEELAEMIGGMQWDLGEYGYILCEESPDRNTTIERVQGVRIDNGFGTSVMINNPEKGTLEVTDARIILTNYTFSGGLQPVAHLIDQLVSQGHRKIVIMARAFSSDVIRLCVENIQKGVEIYPINAPYEHQGEVFKDIQSVVGGTYVDQESGRLEDMTLDDVGYVERLVARRYDAIIMGTQNPETRVGRLIEELQGEPSVFYQKNLQKRISQLTNGFAVLKVGSETDVDRKRRKDKCDDVVNAVRLALQGGTIRGGGLALKQISEMLPESCILKRPLNAIHSQIINSAPEGFVIEDWVRDPYLVIKASLENAVSVASNLATVNAVVVEKDKKYEKSNATEEAE